MNKTPKFRFKEFSGDWESKKLGTICDVTMGQSPSSSCYNERNIGLPLIQGNADVQGRKTAPRIYTSDITKTCNIGDIIMSVRAPVGAISKSIHDACIGRGVCSIKPKQSNEFIYQFLVKYEDKWSRISQGSTFESVNRTDITDTKVSIPSKEEQEKIASFFSLIDDKISLQGEKVEALKDYKKGMMQKIFSRELRFKDDDGGDYPEWEEKKLGELFNIKAGGDIKLENVSKEMTDKKRYPVYANALSNKGLYGYTDTFKVEGNTITVTGRGDIGHAIARNNKYYPIVRLLVLSPIEKLDTVFFENIINFTNIFIESTGVPQLTSPQLSEVKVRVPGFEEQNKIAKLLKGIDIKIEKEQDKLDSLNEYKKGLLQQMFV